MKGRLVLEGCRLVGCVHLRRWQSPVASPWCLEHHARPEMVRDLWPCGLECVAATTKWASASLFKGAYGWSWLLLLLHVSGLAAYRRRDGHRRRCHHQRCGSKAGRRACGCRRSGQGDSPPMALSIRGVGGGPPTNRWTRLWSWSSRPSDRDGKKFPIGLFHRWWHEFLLA